MTLNSCWGIFEMILIPGKCENGEERLRQRLIPSAEGSTLASFTHTVTLRRRLLPSLDFSPSRGSPHTSLIDHTGWQSHCTKARCYQNSGDDSDTLRHQQIAHAHNFNQTRRFPPVSACSNWGAHAEEGTHTHTPTQQNENSRSVCE